MKPAVIRTVSELAKSLREYGIPPSLGPEISPILIQLWRRLAQGKPVSPEQVDQIVAKVSIPRDEVISFLNQTSERDSEGNIVGIIGLSLRSHPHRFQVKGHTFSTWCAWDSLFLPLMLNQTANVESTCPQTKKKIRLTIGPETVQTYEPSSAVVSIVIPKPTKQGPESVQEIWNVFCHQVHYFSSSDAANQWFNGKNQDVVFLSIEDAYQLGRVAFEELLQYA